MSKFVCTPQARMVMQGCDTRHILFRTLCPYVQFELSCFCTQFAVGICWHFILTRVKEECCRGKKVLCSVNGGRVIARHWWKSCCSVSRKSVVEEKKVLCSVNGGRVIARHWWKSCWSEKGRVDQIFQFRFGRRYFILGVVLFSRLESCFVVIGQDSVSMGFKYEPTVIVKDWYTSKQHNFTLFSQFTFSSATSPFFFLFGEFFRAVQERLTFERFDLLVSFCLPSKPEL